MERRIEKESNEIVDLEWIELMKVAKSAGLTKREIRDFIRSFSFKSIETKA